MGRAGNVHLRRHMTIVDDTGIHGRLNALCRQRDISYGVRAAVAAQAADSVAAMLRDDLHFSRTVGDAVHHLQAARDTAQADGFIALGDHGSLCRTVVERSAKETAHHQAAAFRHVFLDDPSGREIIVAQHVNGRAVHRAVPDGLC